jgi:hypothetical protein
VYIWRVRALTLPEESTKFVGDFNGSTLVTDPETGFLESPSDPHKTGQLLYGNGSSPKSLFHGIKKAQAINLLRTHWPDISKVCDILKISRRTFTNHYNVDELFREMVDDIKYRRIDRIHVVRMEVAETKPGSFDRMCVLNAHMPELYNPKTVIAVEHSIDPMQAPQRDKMLDKFIDAEVVETVKRVRKQRDPR